MADDEAKGSFKNDSDNNFYRRRLDRSPDKPEFYQLPETDRRLICQLRSAMETVHDKVTKLKDQVDDRYPR